MNRLAAFMGELFIALGIIEVAVRMFSDEPLEWEAVAFWFTSLCGGGSLILAGRFGVRTVGVSKGLVAVGCLLGSIATAWTLLLPLLALALLALTILETPAAATPQA